MASMINSFALLGDEEGDDMTVLVEKLAKKVEVTVVDPAEPVVVAKNHQSKVQPGNEKAESAAVRSERGRGRGGRGRGPGRGGFGGNESEQFGNEQENGYRRSNWDESKGNGHDDAYRGRGRGRGGGRGRGRGRGFNNDHVNRDEKEITGDNKSNVEDAADGWEQVPQAHSRGYGNYVSNRDEERPFRTENRNFGGERRGYGGGNRGFRARRDGMNYGKGEQPNNEEVKENVGGVDANDVKVVPDNAVAEGDADVVTEEPTSLVAEEKTQEEVVKVENPAKKEEEEDANLMTLEEYEKLLVEKRKAIEAQKIEVRKVTADKDFEAMQLVGKKKEEDVLIKPEAGKLKKKDSLEKDEKSRKTVSINEFLKPADGEEFVYRRAGRGRGRGGRGGDFRNGERGGRGGEFRNGERGGRGGEFRNGERSAQGGEFRNGNGERALRNNGGGYPRGNGRARDGPIIHIEDQSQFPVLKGAAPAVEAA